MMPIRLFKFYFLFGLLYLLKHASATTTETNVIFSIDSSDEDSDSQETGGGDEDSESNENDYGAYTGFGADLLVVDHVPTLAFYNVYDDDRVYCLGFSRSFEAMDYNETSCEYEEIDESEIEFDDLTWTYQACNETQDCKFVFYASSDKWSNLEFTFYLRHSNESEYFVKFDIDLTGYDWEDDDLNSTDSFVLEFTIDDCSSELSNLLEDSESNSEESGASASDSDETEDGDNDGSDSNEDQDEDEERRLLSSRSRLLMQTAESSDGDTSSGDGDNTSDDSENESGSGSDSDSDSSSSSSDSKEFDLDASYFAIEDTANDGQVSVFLCPQTSGISGAKQGLHVVYSHFDTDLSQDPTAGVDNSELDFKEENGVWVVKTNLFLMGVIAIAVYLL